VLRKFANNANNALNKNLNIIVKSNIKLVPKVTSQQLIAK